MSPQRMGLVAVCIAAAGLWLSWPTTQPPPPTPVPSVGTTAEPAPVVPGDPPVITRPAPVQPPSAVVEPRPADAVAEGVRLRHAAQALYRKAKVLEAVELFKKSVELDPSAENHAAYGRAMRDMTAIDLGLYHLRAAAAAEPGNADRWIELANAYSLKPDPGLAWDAEKHAREAEPGIQLRRNERGKLVRADDSGPGRE